MYKILYLKLILIKIVHRQFQNFLFNNNLEIYFKNYGKFPHKLKENFFISLK